MASLGSEVSAAREYHTLAANAESPGINSTGEAMGIPHFKEYLFNLIEP